MAAFSAPTVTEDDLWAFHSKHFPSAPAPQTLLSALVQDEDDDDGLGWYSDGVKRRITDEQIAIFRHSETFKIIREREIAEISGQGNAHDHTMRANYTRAAVPLKDLRPSDVLESDLTQGLVADNGITKNKNGHKEKSSTHNRNWRKKRNVAKRKRQAQEDAGRSSRDAPGDDDHDEHQSAGRALGSNDDHERSGKRGWSDYVDTSEGNASRRTHRRLARELDEQKAEVIELMYD